HGDSRGFKASRKPFEGSGIGDLPTEDLSARLDSSVDKQALFAIVHAEGTHRAGAIHRLHPNVCGGERSPVIELERADAKITEGLAFHAPSPGFSNNLALGACRGHQSIGTCHLCSSGATMSQSSSLAQQAKSVSQRCWVTA